MGRKILVCPFGQLNGSVQNFAAGVSTLKNTDSNRFDVFTFPSAAPQVFPGPSGTGVFTKYTKVFFRRYRIFSEMMSQGAKIYNLGFAGNVADAFLFHLKIYKDGVGTPAFDYVFDSKYCPALNEWNDINSLYGPSPFVLNENYSISAVYKVTVDTTNLPAAILAANIPNDLRFELELDV